MDEDQPLNTLIAMKARLGPLAFIQFNATDLPSIHYQLGELLRPQIQKILSDRLARLSTSQRAQEIAAAQQIHAALLDRIASPAIECKVREALEVYLDCLHAWSQGAQLHTARFNSPANPTPGAPSALELALFLQKERAGCQTGAYRLPDGSVLFWHTEEDGLGPGRRFDRLRIVTYPIRAGNRMIEGHAFLYPDLLPGPTFCWRSDRYLQAVDSLPLKHHSQPGAILANIATWVTFNLGSEVNPRETIEMLAPFWDGYAITCAQEQGGRVTAQKIEFAGEGRESEVLGEQAGATHFQVNLFSDRAAALAEAYQHIHEQRQAPLRARLARTHRALDEMIPGRQPLQSFYNLLCSRSGGSYAYANCDVKATYLAHLAAGRLESWVGAGPALEDDLPHLTRIID